MLLRPLFGFLDLTISAILVGAATSSSDLNLPHLFSFELQAAADLDAIVYPYGGGQRLNIVLGSGTMATPSNGTVATVVPGLGAEQGIFRDDGVFIADARVVLQVDQAFDPDRKFAFLQFRGKSAFTADGASQGLNFIEFETDSPSFTYLSGYFLAGKLIRDGSTLNIEVYGANPSTI